MTSEERMAICKTCPIRKEDPVYGIICDSSKYMNKATGEVSRLPHSGWIKGCGCKMNYKVKSPSAHCVANKW